MCVAADLVWLTKISDVYKEDEWTKKLVRHLWDDITKDKAGEDSEGILVLKILYKDFLDGREKASVAARNGLLYVGD